MTGKERASFKAGLQIFQNPSLPKHLLLCQRVPGLFSIKCVNFPESGVFKECCKILNTGLAGQKSWLVVLVQSCNSQIRACVFPHLGIAIKEQLEEVKLHYSNINYKPSDKVEKIIVCFGPFIHSNRDFFFSLTPCFSFTCISKLVNRYITNMKISIGLLCVTFTRY